MEKVTVALLDSHRHVFTHVLRSIDAHESRGAKSD